MIKIILLVLLAEALTVVGQILMKKSANNLSVYDLSKVNAHMRFLREVLAKPSLWAGFFMMALGLLVWLFALAQGDLSLVFSLGSVQYILILILAHYMLGEKIDRMKVIGTLFVMAGIVLIVMSK